jgi:hypothetical protein
MIKPFDEGKSYISVKAHEGIIAFVGFLIEIVEGEAKKEGVLKISSSEKAYGGGYLTLTFIVDTEDLPAVKEHLGRHFANLTASTLEPFIGKTLERINKVQLDQVLHSHNWYVEEINIHLTVLKGEEKPIVEQCLIPAFEKILPCSFLSLEWWPMESRETEDSSRSAGADVSIPEVIKDIFQKWFKPEQE